MVRQNILANIIGRAWGVIAIYIFIPFYLKFLGIEAYGLIGFYSTLLGVLSFADIGLTATLNRELARLSTRENTVTEMGDLLRTYECVYVLISVAVTTIIWALAPFIAERWLRVNSLSPESITTAVRLMGISISLQLLSALYNGGLSGLQKQVLTNALQIAWGMVRGIGAVAALWLISPTVFTFLCWQIFSNAVYCFVVRYNLWHTLPFQKVRSQINLRVFRHTWRYSMSMLVLTFIGVLLMQTDKLAVSKMLSLEMFGYYTLAGALATAPLILASPIAVAIFPKLTGLVEIGDETGLRHIYHRACGLVSVVVIPAGLTLALYSRNFIYAWTGSDVAAQEAGMAASLLLLGQIMQAVVFVPYYLALAFGRPKLNIQIGIASILLIAPILIFFIKKFGIVGGGISWLMMNMVSLPAYMYFFHRRFLPGELKNWSLYDVGRPMLAAFPVILLLHQFLPSSTSSRIMTLVEIVLVSGVATVIAVINVPLIRCELVKRSKNILGFCYGK
jgi:O-antigen/teichoic acid export membrane protein